MYLKQSFYLSIIVEEIHLTSRSKGSVPENWQFKDSWTIQDVDLSVI